MTELEKRAIRALQSVAMPKEGWHAGRAEYLNMRLALQPNSRLIATQAGDLWYLVWRYRRQITDSELVAHANGRRGQKREQRWRATRRLGSCAARL